MELGRIEYYREYAKIVMEETTAELKEMALQLDKWADESRSGGWSTHQVDPMRKKAVELREKVQHVENRYKRLQ